MSAEADPRVEPYPIYITGHRPEELASLPRATLLDLATQAIEVGIAHARQQGYTRVDFITGGARGIDQLLARAAHLHPTFPTLVRYRLYLPFPPEVMSAMWRDHRLFDRLVADVPVPVRVLAPVFSKAAYHQRNAAMVDDAREGIAFWSGRRTGGTYACLRYALAVPRGATDIRCPTVNALQAFAPITPALLRAGGVPT